MIIENRVLFFVATEKWDGKSKRYQKTTKDGQQKIYNDTGKLRMRVRWNNETLTFNLGFRVFHEKWINEAQRCKANTTHHKQKTASTINAKISEYEDKISDVFKAFEVKELIPRPEELKKAFNLEIGKEKKQYQPQIFFDFFDAFVNERGQQNDWTAATFTKFNTVKSHLNEFDSQLKFAALDESKLNDYVFFLRSTKNMMNSTIKKQLGYLKWFLNWADTKKLITINDYKTFKPKLKQAHREVVYLTADELKQLREYKIPESKKYLQRVRDVFLFGCNTSLRYSDIFNLRRSNIVGDKIHIVTQKTNDKLTIKLTAEAKNILDKYKNTQFKDDRALPVISNQKMNEYLKDLCKDAGIDTPITQTQFKGNERIDTTKPKHKLIGSHTARRTFICNALLQGMPAHAVMKITGHSDYKAMQPYISIVAKEVDDFMDKLNF